MEPIMFDCGDLALCSKVTRIGEKRKIRKKRNKLVPEGVEPSTLTLLASHSNQLSYGTDYV